VQGKASKDPVYLRQWFSTGVPRHTRVPWTSAANCYFSLIFIPIKLARGAAKYLKYEVRVPRTKKCWETLIYVNTKFKAFEA